MALPADIASRITATAGQPCVEVELAFPGGYVKRISDVAHTRAGNAYAADLVGDLTWEKTLDPKFNDLKFKVQNVDGAYTDLFGAYTPPQLQQTVVTVYETFLDATNRVERWRGKLNVPSGFDRQEVGLEATQLLNSLLEPFNGLVNSPMCPWAEQCRFAGGDRCNYNPTTAGSCLVLLGNVDTQATFFPCDSPGDTYTEGDYILVDNEIVLVTDVLPGGLEVTRAQKGTNRASHNQLAKLKHQNCNGDWASCKRRGMLHRFGGLKFFVMSGTVTWKEKMSLFFSQKHSEAWESQSNNGIFGNPWGVLYGTTKVTLDPLYVRDTGPVATFFASVGCGPIQGLLSEQSGAHGYILLNGKPHRDYGSFNGDDGLRQIQWNSTAYGQGISYLWWKDPQTATGSETFEDAQEKGQTLSRRAYIGGAFPSDIKVQESMPTIEAVYKGRKLDMYNHDGSFSWTGYTNNPAWIFLDAGVNKDYGAGLALTDYDLPALYQASVDFAALGITWNVYLKEQMKFPDLVQVLCNSTLSFPTFHENKLGLKVLKADMAHSGITLDSSVILEGGFTWWEDGPVDRDANTLKVDVVSPEFDYQTTQMVFNDEAHIASLGGRKRELSLKLGGINSVAQAERIGAFWLNLAKICRRMDGVKKLRCTYRGMEIDPGMIITIDTDGEDGLGALDYLVWSVKRSNNDGDYELVCVRWDPGLFELGGISYTLPTTGTNPTLDPAPVESLAAVAELIGTDDVRLTVSWAWPSPVAPIPGPARVFLWIGEAEAPPDTYELMTPNGLGRDVTAYQTTFPRRRWKNARVFAIGQSSFGVPSNARPNPRPDYDTWDLVDGGVDELETTYSLKGDGNLSDPGNLAAGDYVILPYMGCAEIDKVVSVLAGSVTVEAWGSDRRAAYGTVPVVHGDGDRIYKMEWSGPFDDVDMAGPVMPPTDAKAYDKNRDPALGWNEIRFEIPKNSNGTPPKHLHVQFDADGAWVDPTESPSGVSDAYLVEPMASTVYVPTSYGLDAGAVGKLFVIKDGTTDRVGRYIEAVDQDVVLDGATWDRVTVQGHLPRGSGYHDWAVWNLWHELQDHQLTVALGDQNLDLANNKYVATVTLPGPYTGFARVYLLNEWSTSDPVVAVDDSELPALLTTDPANAIDTEPAPLVDNFAVTPQGYTLPDGTQKVVVNISFDQPDPKGTFSHIIVFASRPSEGIPGKEGEVGWGNAPGYYKEIIGEIYESGTPVILNPDASDNQTQFMAVSVNQDGYYPINWVQNGINQPGGYRFAYCPVLPEDTAPPASSEVVATFNPGAGINVVWDAIAIPDLAEWQVEMRKATTEAGLPAASYVAQSETRSTLHQHFCTQDDNGYWFQFRIRAVDNTGHLGAWAESNAVRAYAGAGLQPVAAPLNFGSAYAWEYRGGVPLCYLTFTWDNPPDPNYGGCEAWLFYPNDAHGELYDRVGYLETPSSKAILPMNGQTVTMRLVPYNRSGIVPDYGVFIQTGAFTLSTATFGETVPAPNVIARDGIGRVSIEATIPAWAGMQKPYTNLSLFISATDNSGAAYLVGKWPVGHASGSTEKMHFEVPFDALTNVAGGPYSTGTNYYFFAKLESNSGNQSAFSVDTDYSAVFIAGNLTDAGAADFAAGAEVLRVAASDKMIFAGWNAPTVNGSTVYLSQMQVARASTFAAGSLVEDYTINAKSGSKGVGLPSNGTYYVRVRYLNNSAAGWSEWFGLKEGGTAYATICTQADQTGDTGYMDGATYITGTYVTLEQQDALQVKIKVGSTATNCATLYNITALWSDTQSKLSDDTAGYLIASPTLTWLDNDSWISTGATTPATTWIGKVLQYLYNSSPNLWISGIITQVDITNKKVQLNVNWGAAKSSQTGRVITPYWERPGVFFKEIGEDCGWHLAKNTDYYLPAINQFASGTTVYFRLIPHNIFGPGTAYDFNLSVGSKAGDVIAKAQGYAHDTAPTGTFASPGYNWAAAANNTVDFVKTFSFTQDADANNRADSFVVFYLAGGGTPLTTDPHLVFPVTHTSGAKGYSLKVPNLDPFTTYSFKTYAAKSTASGLVLGTNSLTDSNLVAASGDLTISADPAASTGLIQFRSYNKPCAKIACGKDGTAYYGVLQILNSAGTVMGSVYSNANQDLVIASDVSGKSVKIGTKLTAAAALDVTGAATVTGLVQGTSGKFGDVAGGNYSEFESDGTLKFNGNASVFDDIILPGYTGGKGGVKDPAMNTFTGNVMLPAFTDEAVNEKELFFVFELPHDYKEGSNVTPHVHFAPEDSTSGTVRWGLEYEWVNINSNYSGTTTTIYANQAVAAAGRHYMTSWSAITGTSKTISSALVCRLFRNSSSATDTYNSKKVWLISMGLHCEKDTAGSRSITTK